MIIILLTQLTLAFGPTLYNQTSNSIEIVYETPTLGESNIHYFDGVSIHIEYSAPNIIHKVLLQNLVPDTVYYYAIEFGGLYSELFAFKTISQGPMNIRFGVWGDNQIGDTVFSRVIRGFFYESATYWLGAGDYVQNESVISEWYTKFDQPMLGLNHYIPIIGARGNHDHETAHAHRYFAVPNGSQWGAITVGNIRFIILDSNEDVSIRTSLLPGGDQRNWLLNEINSPPFQLAKFKIVIYHHPHMTNIWDHGCYYGQSGNGIDIILFDIVNTILVPAGVNMIINGHSHSYQHGLIVNTHHVITGGAGGFLDTANCWQHPHIFSQESSFHYLTIDATDNILDVRAIRLNGDLIEQFRISQ